MLTAPGTPPHLAGRLHERGRWEWRHDDGGDPLVSLAEFLGDAGLPVADLIRPGPPRPGAPVGAAILVGGGVVPAASAGRVALPPTPCPGVPDVAAVVYGVAPYARRARAGAARVGEWTPSWSGAEHGDAVEQVRQAIARGDVYQVNVVAHRAAPVVGDPAALAAALRTVPDTPYGGALTGGDWCVVSASPELFLEVHDGVVRTRPIKGTVRRGATPRDDRAARAQLRNSAKDRAEHVMIVDLERNDLGRVAETGTVRVDELYAVRPRAGVWHAESTVSGRLRAGVGLAELLAATFPGGSVTGAPKLAALQVVGALEPVGRGPAMGALGWIGGDGSIKLGLTIRTFAVAGGIVHLWVGGGITWSSSAEAEVAEAHAKAAPLLAALRGVTSDAGSAG